MTCIVALEHNGKVYMGGDSAASNGETVQVVLHPKVFTRGDFLIGYTGSFRMGQLLQFDAELDFPKAKDVIILDVRKFDYSYMVQYFIPVVRECLRKGGVLKSNNGVECLDEGSVFLVGYHGKAYYIDSNFSVLKTEDTFIACGSGETFALGSLETSKALVEAYGPEAVVREALRVAARFSPHVRPPFAVISL